MSLSFDDQLLGEKVHNYCSSSSSDEENETYSDSQEMEDEDKFKEPKIKPPEDMPKYEIRHNGPKTGPKGVKSDYDAYRIMEYHRKLEEKSKFIAEVKEKCLTGLSYREEQMLDNEADDSFMEEYRRKRIQQMIEASKLPTFKQVYDLSSSSFIEEIDNVHPNVSILVHIYERSDICNLVNSSFDYLCLQYPHSKFCRMKASDASMSHAFSKKGVPAIVIYKNKDLIGNLLRPDKELGIDFGFQDLENLLVEHGYLPDKSADPTNLMT